jgi:hypothetical protein
MPRQIDQGIETMKLDPPVVAALITAGAALIVGIMANWDKLWKRAEKAEKSRKYADVSDGDIISCQSEGARNTRRSKVEVELT